jgi:5-methylcytosine-specific restriction endonuclease McrA
MNFGVTAMVPYVMDIDEATIRKERQKARELRETQWWKRRLAKGVCEYCGGPTSPQELTMDHIVPISRGGRSTKGNVVPACKECNTAKKHLLPMEWDQYINQKKTEPYI